MQKIKEFVHKNETRLEIGFFVAGVVVDIVMLPAPDDLISIIQQIVYLGLIYLILHFELLRQINAWVPGPKMAKYWENHRLILHFLMGSILNLYSLFFIKSASLFSSIIFLLVMGLIVVGNELPIFKKSNVSFKIAVFVLCVFSFFSILFPVILGYVGYVPLASAVAATALIVYLMFKHLNSKIRDTRLTMQSILAPSFTVMGLFIAFYFIGWIPPVPISVKEQAIYHNITKENGQYKLFHQKPWWKFWENGDETFLAQPGDSIYYFAQIYSPANFNDQVFVVWSFLNAKGNWEIGDKIPINISGGREQGFRGYTYKSNYQEGKWRVQLVSRIGQEISRLYFEVTKIHAGTNREFNFDLR